MGKASGRGLVHPPEVLHDGRSHPTRLFVTGACAGGGDHGGWLASVRRPIARDHAVFDAICLTAFDGR